MVPCLQVFERLAERPAEAHDLRVEHLKVGRRRYFLGRHQVHPRRFTKTPAEVPQNPGRRPNELQLNLDLA